MDKSISTKDLHEALRPDYDYYKAVDSKEGVKKAKIHKRANKVGELLLQFSKGFHEFCQCCKMPCYKKKYDFSVSTDKFTQFSTPVSIYFKFNIFCIFLLLFAFLFYGVLGNFVLAKNVTARECFFNDCFMDRLFIQSYTATVHKIFFTITLVCMIIFKDAFFLYIRKYNIYQDEKKITPSDFTAHIKDLDPNWTEGQIETELKHYFQKIDNNLQIKKINLVYNIEDQVNLIKQYSIQKRQETILKKKIDFIQKKKQQRNLPKLKKYNQKLKEIRKDLKKINSDIKELTDGSDQTTIKFTGQAFVTFATQQSLRNVIKSHQRKFLNITFQRGTYKIERAFEPKDLIWENLGIKKLEKFKRRFLSYFISILIIAISFFIILGLSYGQENISIESTISKYSITLLISLTIIIINVGLRFALIQLTHQEKRTTYTYQTYNIVFKVTLAYFVNMALIILITNLVVWDSQFNLVLFYSSGVAPKTQVVLILTVFSDFLFTLLNPFYLLKKSQRIYYNRKIKKGDLVLQCELNYANEGIIFDIAGKYYTMFKIMTFCFFYMTVSPYLLLFGIFHLVLSFLVNKYMLIRKCNRPVDLDFKFSAKMIENLEMCTFIMACGYFAFIRIITGEFDSLSIILFVIAAFDWLIMDLYVINKMFRPKLELEHITYDDTYLTFPVDYDRENPMTQKEAFKEWFGEMQLRKQGLNQKVNGKNQIGFSMINPKKKQKKYDFDILLNYINNNPNQQSNIFGNQIRLYDLQNDTNVYKRDYEADVDLYKLNDQALFREKNYYYQTQFLQGQPNLNQQDYQNRLLPLDYPLNDVPLVDNLDKQDVPLNIQNQQKDFGMFVSVFKPKQIQTEIYNIPDDQQGLLINNNSPQNTINDRQQQDHNLYPQFQNRYFDDKRDQKSNRKDVPIDPQKVQINLNQNKVPQNPNKFGMNQNQNQPDIPQNQYQVNENQIRPDIPQNQYQVNENQIQPDIPQNQYGPNFNSNQQPYNQYQINFNQNQQENPQNQYQLNFNNQHQNQEDIPLNNYPIQFNTNNGEQQDQPLNINSNDFQINLDSEKPLQKQQKNSNDYDLKLSKKKSEDDEKDFNKK